MFSRKLVWAILIVFLEKSMWVIILNFATFVPWLILFSWLEVFIKNLREDPGVVNSTLTWKLVKNNAIYFHAKISPTKLIGVFSLVWDHAILGLCIYVLEPCGQGRELLIYPEWCWIPCLPLYFYFYFYPHLSSLHVFSFYFYLYDCFFIHKFHAKMPSFHQLF